MGRSTRSSITVRAILWQTKKVLMNITEVFRISWEAVLKNKIRSLLTMLGIIIGVAAVIIMIAVSNGTASAIASQITSLGSNLIFILPQLQPATACRPPHRPAPAGLHGCSRHPAERPECGRRERGAEFPPRPSKPERSRSAASASWVRCRISRPCAA